MMIRVAIALLFLTAMALAHDEAQWIKDGLFMAQHGGLCCGPEDCRALTKGRDYTVGPAGYQLRSGEIILHSQVVHRAPDERLWVCRNAQGVIKPGCIFDAPGSF